VKLVKKTAWLTLILIACIVAFVVEHRRHADQTPPSAIVMIFGPGYKIPKRTSGGSILDRVMPLGRSWEWLWKLRYALFGKGQIVSVNNTLFNFEPSDLSMLSSLREQPDLTATNGMRIWRVNEDELHSLQQHMNNKPDQILASAGIISGVSSECSMFTGQSLPVNRMPQNVGLSVNLLPSLHKQAIDLTLVYSFSEAITNTATSTVDSVFTNFEFAARIQLPREMAGVFVLASKPWGSNQKQVALLLTASIAKVKK
jgi:hypothetical protein